MKPAQTISSGSYRWQVSASAWSHSSRESKSLTLRVNVGMFALAARSSAPMLSRSAPTATTVAP